MLAAQSRLMEIHRKLIQDNDEARIANSTLSEVTEFSLESHILLEPILGPQGHIHTRRPGPIN